MIITTALLLFASIGILALSRGVLSETYGADGIGGPVSSSNLMIFCMYRRIENDLAEIRPGVWTPLDYKLPVGKLIDRARLNEIIENLLSRCKKAA